MKHAKRPNHHLLLQIEGMENQPATEQAVEMGRKENLQQTLYDFVNEPEYLDLRAIAEEEVPTRLAALLQHMAAYGVRLDFVGGGTPSDIYAFITRFLFWMPMSELEEAPVLVEPEIPESDYFARKLKSVVDDILLQGCDPDRSSIALQLAEFCIDPSGDCFSKATVLEKLASYVAAGGRLQHWKGMIREIRISNNPECSIAEVNGLFVRMPADANKLPAGVGGPLRDICFSFHFKIEEGRWELYYFRLPGFNW